MVTERARRPLPPYVSYRTFRNFIDGLQLGVPARIDRSYWGERFSGSTGTQLMSALRFLGLVDNQGVPMTRLRQFVTAKGAQRSDVLRQIGNSAYDVLTESSLDPQVSTYAQLEEAFANTYQVSGDVARKCIKFFVSLETDAGIIFSPFITRKSNRLQGASGRKKANKKTAVGTNRNTAIPTTTAGVPNHNGWYEMVLAKFPTFDPGWSDDVKIQWFQAFDSLLKKDSSLGK